MPWCHGAWCCLYSSVAPVPPSRPLSLMLLCVLWCGGLSLCPLLCVRPSLLRVPCLADGVPSFFLPRCGILYPFLYPLLVSPSPWRAFFPASLASLCVARLFPLRTSLFSQSSLLCVATGSCLLFWCQPARHWRPTKVCVWTGWWDGSGCSRVKNEYVVLALLVLAFCHTLRYPCLRVCGHRRPGILLALLAFGFVLCVFCCRGVHSYHASFRGVGVLLRFVCSRARCVLVVFPGFHPH